MQIGLDQRRWSVYVQRQGIFNLILNSLKPAGWIFRVGYNFDFLRDHQVMAMLDFYIKENKMAKKAKRLCKWKEEELAKKFDEFIDIVKNPAFICKKCGRVADKKKWLHKPAELK